MINIPQAKDLFTELVFTTSRSGGPGGQHVNKVSTKVTLKWDVAHSQLLSVSQKELLLKQWSSRLTKEGALILTAQDKRSQLQNKGTVIQKLDRILTQALTPKKARKVTKLPKSAKRKRKESKKLRSEKKIWRKKVM